MNKRQKEILNASLKNEKDILKRLKKLYKNAERAIDEKIAYLMARKESQNLQSIIYQLDYQKALKKQIGAILDDLNSNQFESISEYLTKSYEDGFIGVMYDLQGQGIPLIFPIDEEQVAKAIIHNTKLSKPLYTRLGEDMTVLKKVIQSELSRGLAQNLSYAEIAQAIGNQTNTGYYRASRIARTEGHRIQNEATYNAQQKAKESGADVVKQWDSTLDGRTRPTHRELDGQIRELDEPFEINGHRAQYPSGFGIAKEDVNCRCAMLQRAKWALGESELDVLKEKASFHGLDKTKDFEEYKEKYLKGGIE